MEGAIVGSACGVAIAHQVLLDCCMLLVVELVYSQVEPDILVVQSKVVYNPSVAYLVSSC